MIDHNSSVFCKFMIKLGKRPGGTNVMAPGCSQVTIATIVGVNTNTKDLFSHLTKALNRILYLAKDIYISYRHIETAQMSISKLVIYHPDII